MKFVMDALRAFRGEYGDAHVPCLLGCSECCSHNPPMVYAEWQLIPASLREWQGNPDGCHFLTKEGRCAIYAYRPTLCRVFGVPPTGKLACRLIQTPHFINPVRFQKLWERYSVALSVDLINNGRFGTREHDAFMDYLKESPSFQMVNDGALKIMAEMRNREYGERSAGALHTS